MAKRVLVIINTIDAGGAETFVMKIFRCLYKDIVFDFLINKKDSVFYLDEITSLGGKVYYGESKSRNPIKSFKCTYRTVKGKYTNVFCIAVHPLGFWDLMAARMAGAKTCLTRSTNSNAGGKASRIIAWICRPLIRWMSDEMLAPSKEAGRWLFGKHAVEKGKVKIITNGIPVEQYRFDEKKRNNKRVELGISDDSFVIGHIGRFNSQKNHDKLLDVFSEFHKKNSSSVLLLIGEGELLQNIKNKVSSLKIEEAVRFLGIRKDIPELLMAMDCFVFPSFFEGMPNAVIEAQATGLPCVVSDSISKDVKQIEDLSFIGLYEPTEVWINAIHNASGARDCAIFGLEKGGYSIEKTAQDIYKMLLSR